MATVDNAAIVREVHQAWNAKDMDRYAALAAGDARVAVVPFNTKLAFREYGEMWASAFPDGQIQVTTLVSQGDVVMTEFTGRGTHTGTLRSPMGDIPATGRRVEMSFAEVYRLRNGKVVESKLYFDAMTMMTLLGVSPGAAATQPRTTTQPPQPRH